MVGTGLKTVHHNSRGLFTIYAFIFVTAIVWAASPSVSGTFVERRITAGAKIFRALLAADVDIVHKTGSDGKLRLCLLYVDDTHGADRAAETLRSRDDSRIREMDVRIDILRFSDFVEDTTDAFAGIFLTQALSDEKLKMLIEYVNEQSIVVFSPIEGDVERGVLGGIAVEARVRPYLNIEALRDADIRLKPFFVRVAKRHER